MVAEISPKSVTFRSLSKLPLVLLTASSGITISTVLVFGKTFGQIYIEHLVTELPVISIGCVLLAGLCGLLVLYFMSLAMRYYDNLDVMPMYQSFILLGMETAGWVILGEIRYYESKEIVGILASSLLVCLGIYVLTVKEGFVAHLKK